MGFSDFLPVCYSLSQLKKRGRETKAHRKASMIKAGDQLGSRALGITQPWSTTPANTWKDKGRWQLFPGDDTWEENQGRAGCAVPTAKDSAQKEPPKPGDTNLFISTTSAATSLFRGSGTHSQPWIPTICPEQQIPQTWVPQSDISGRSDQVCNRLSKAASRLHSHFQLLLLCGALGQEKLESCF